MAIFTQLRPSQREAWETLLQQEGLQADSNLDYIAVAYDDEGEPIATGSCFGNTLRCFAVRSDHQGEGLLEEVMTHLMEVQFARGNRHIFLYTKISTAPLFRSLGFYEIARVSQTLVFMENRRTGFAQYLEALRQEDAQGRIGAIVMNANPFTLGHLYLVEYAAARCDTLHLFLVSEDSSLVPFAVRKRLVQEGISHLPQVILHDSGPYIISNATFPSYFLKAEEKVMEGHAQLDVALFLQIATALHIQARFVGEEPTSRVTNLYNQVLERELPKAGIECIQIPRKEVEGRAISASVVRQCLKKGDWESMKSLVPATTYRFFRSEEAKPILQAIQQAEQVVHH